MVHQFAEAYGWTLDEIYALTMPQIILLSHAGAVSYQRIKDKSEGKNKSKKPVEAIYRGKRIEELNSHELAQYYSTGEGFGSITVM